MGYLLRSAVGNLHNPQSYLIVKFLWFAWLGLILKTFFAFFREPFSPLVHNLLAYPSLRAISWFSFSSSARRIVLVLKTFPYSAVSLRTNRPNFSRSFSERTNSWCFTWHSFPRHCFYEENIPLSNNLPISKFSKATEH